MRAFSKLLQYESPDCLISARKHSTTSTAPSSPNTCQSINLSITHQTFPLMAASLSASRWFQNLGHLLWGFFFLLSATLFEGRGAFLCRSSCQHIHLLSLFSALMNRSICSGQVPYLWDFCQGPKISQTYTPARIYTFFEVMQCSVLGGRRFCFLVWFLVAWNQSLLLSSEACQLWLWNVSEMNRHKPISLPSIFLTPPRNHPLTLTSPVTDRSLAGVFSPSWTHSWVLTDTEYWYH